MADAFCFQVDILQYRKKDAFRGVFVLLSASETAGYAVFTAATNANDKEAT